MNFDDQESFYLESYDDLYNKSQCGYITWLATGEIVRINSTCLKWLGFDRDELLMKMNFWDLLTTPGKIYYETHFVPLLFIQGDVNEIQLDLKSKMDKKIPVLINAVLLESKHEKPVKFFRATLFDISQRKQYESELLIQKRKAEEATDNLIKINTELEKFAKIVSHDLKSPLAGIISLSALVKSNYEQVNDEKFAKSLYFIHDTALKLSKLIDGILKFYLSQANYFHSLQIISLQKAINEILSLFPVENLHVTLPENPISIHVNKTVFEQILLNLISNAINYNDKEKIEITIEFSENIDFYFFTIRDNGVGIPENKFETIFEVFKTLGNTDRFKKQGTGVGLSTVKKMVLSAKGSISVESKLNEFTSFQFSLKKQI
jgi:phosphoserine phosphatase RsbU/P